MGSYGLLLAFLWGLVWASALEWAPWGRYLAARRTWLAVVVGVGVDLALLATMLELGAWLVVCEVIGLSAVGMVLRSVVNEWRDHEALLRRSGGADGDEA